MGIGNAFFNSLTGGSFLTGLVTPNLWSAKALDMCSWGAFGMMGMWGGGFGWGLPFYGYGMDMWGMNPAMWMMY